MSQQNQQNDNRVLRYIAKIKEYTTRNGSMQKILLDSLSGQNADGTENQYHQGELIWNDKATGKMYLVKQLAIRGASQKDASRGVVNSIAIDLADPYQVQELDS